MTKFVARSTISTAAASVSTKTTSRNSLLSSSSLYSSSTIFSRSSSTSLPTSSTTCLVRHRVRSCHNDQRYAIAGIPSSLLRGYHCTNNNLQYSLSSAVTRNSKRIVSKNTTAATRRTASTSSSRANSTSNLTIEQQNQKAAYDYYKKKPSASSKYFGWLFKKKNKPKVNKESQSPQQKNVNTAWYMFAMAVGSLGASYAAVPLYKVFCQTTGFGGTTQRVNTENNSSNVIDAIQTINDTIRNIIVNVLPESWMKSINESVSKNVKGGTRVHTWTDEDAITKLASLKPVENAELITIRFDTTVNDILPWSFVPIQLDVKVVPGETALSFFRVTNHSNKAITGVATYNVYPPKTGLYFQKIQCFCFEEQRLLPNETVDMPVFFYIDPDILNDSQVSYVKSITLSYTFFQTDEDDDEDDEEIVVQK